MKKAVVLLAILLAILHQDSWNWDNAGLVLGFMPAGLFYHACYSIAAALLWAFTIKFAWPKEIVAWAEDDSDEGEGAG